MLSRWVRKPRPTSDTEHSTQEKHSLCHWRSSKEIYLAPARPAHIKQRYMNGIMCRLMQDLHLSNLTSMSKENCMSECMKTWAQQWLTGDGLGAAHTLLCIEVAEAFEAVGVVLPGGEALTGQLLLAADAQETLTVPGFVLVGHSTCCYCLKVTQIHGWEWHYAPFLHCS